jgi:hypothetical protein
MGHHCFAKEIDDQLIGRPKTLSSSTTLCSKSSWFTPPLIIEE